jgi:CubicO group peptidase (beta-lactamase class C family)
MMRRPAAPLSAVLVSWLAAVGAAPAGAEVATHPRVKEATTFLALWLQAQAAYEQIPGVSAAVVHDQELVWSTGIGWADPARRKPAQPSTVYSICSISKLFTSVAVLQLRDEGRLRLDDPVEKHLSWFAVKSRPLESGPITIDSLLTHSAGFQEDPSFPYWTGKFEFPDRDEIIARLPDEEMLYPAQQRYEYSNLGMFLAGEIVAAASGTPYPKRVTDGVLRPLGLGDTTPEMPSSLRGSRLAVGHSAVRRDGRRVPLPFFQAKAMAPAAGFASTVEDLARFASWQFRVLGTGRTEVLAANTLREMYRVRFMDPAWEAARGLGFKVWRAGSSTMVGHGGDCPGFRTAIQLHPDSRVASIFMANASGVPAEAYAARVHDIVSPALRLAAALPAGGPEPPPSPYLGTYDFGPWGGEFLVFPWEGGLAMLEVPSRDPLGEMVRLGPVPGRPHHFRRLRTDGAPGEPITFEVDDEGRAVRLWRWNNPFPRVGP